MKKAFSLFLAIIFFVSLCSCSNVYTDEYSSEEYEILELDVSLVLCDYYLPIAREYDLDEDEDRNEILSPFGRYAGSFYGPFFGDYDYEGYGFFAHGDKAKIIYNKNDYDLELSRKVSATFMTKIERIKNANVQKVSDELIIRDEEGKISSINVPYANDGVIIIDQRYGYLHYNDFTGDEIYMSVAMNQFFGEERCVFYSFNPNEV